MKIDKNDDKLNKFINNLSNKKIFLVQVFSNLIFQIIIAFIVLMYAEHKQLIYTKIQFIFIIISLIVLVIFMNFVKSSILKFLLFCIFSSLIGLLLSYKFKKDDPQELELAKKALMTTIIIFIYIVLFGFFLVYLGVKIPYQLSIALFLILLLIIIVLFVTGLTGTFTIYQKSISGFIIFIFSIFIAYDTVNIMDKNYNGDYISASLDYFLDILNIFVNISN